MSLDRKHRIILTGAGGNVGSRVAKRLLPSHGGSVILTGRDRMQFRGSSRQGAQIRIGSLEDSQFLSRLFRNADAALIMVPFPRQVKAFNLFQRRAVESLFDAIKGSALQYILHVSCLGAHRPDKTGPIMGSYDLERRLNWLPEIHIVHLRPGLFMEDLVRFLAFDSQKGIVTSPLYPHTPLPMISVEDVAQAAAECLLTLSFRGQTIRPLPGPKALSMDRIVNIIGDVMNRRDLQYELTDYETAKDGLVAKGYSEEWAESWMSCFKSMNEEKDLFGNLERETVNHKPFDELAPSFIRRFKECCR